ncbi:long-chain-fatty-acid--CoA ligase [Sphaerisporangium rhizosphaerae]|uniref:Long-chain-fatty-acid--CoA ligase n=1 Tax=Sphaerisporangium rhizosphaerae TaxID=2269375 RepID=A0ABW2P5F4_9ACTN
MRSGMMESPLTIPGMVTSRAERLFARRPVVTRSRAGVTRLTWGDVVARARRLAGALAALGVGPGDRVATFAGGTHRHVEAYLAATSMGAVLHTVNVHLPAEHVAYIVDHADDTLVLCEAGLLPAWEEAESRLTRRRPVVVLPDGDGDEPPAGGRLGYERLLAEADPLKAWPEVEEAAAAHVSYTTGTTGRPKGVVFSHRSTVLQSFCAGLADAESLSSGDTLLALVPLSLSQVGLPFSAAMHGCGLLLPGGDLTPAGVCELIERERPTVSVGFGAALTGLLDHWRRHRPDLSSLRRMVCGGSPVPRAVSRAFEEEVGVPIVQVFGMTETSGHGSFSRPPAEAGERPSEETRAYYAVSQGRPLAMVDMRIADDTGGEVPWDGASMGELQVRGPWVVREYFRDGSPPDKFQQGWLRTGDAARIDELGYIRIVDRMKDLIRANGEWISTVELEEHLMAHPAVADAAVVGVPDAESGERPLACVVLREGDGAGPAPEEFAAHLAGRVPPSWLPTVRVVTELPRTGVGKVDKRALRERFGAARPAPEA